MCKDIKRSTIPVEVEWKEMSKKDKKMFKEPFTKEKIKCK